MNKGKSPSPLPICFWRAMREVPMVGPQMQVQTQVLIRRYPQPLPHQLSRIGIESTDPVASANAAAADSALL